MRHIPPRAFTIPAARWLHRAFVSEQFNGRTTPSAAAGKISGAASIVKLGNSTLTMSTTNDFTGNFIIGGGTVQLSGITAVAGATNGTLVISNGATLAVNLSGSYPAGDAGFGNKPIVVSGTGANGQGAIQFTGGPLYNDSSTFGLGQNITLAGNTTFSGAGRFDWGYPGAGTTLSTRGSNYNLTVSVGGTIRNGMTSALIRIWVTLTSIRAPAASKPCASRLWAPAWAIPPMS